MMENGKIITKIPTPDELRDYVLSQLSKIGSIDKLPWE